MKILYPLFFLCLVVSCKTAEKSFIEKTVLVEAIWSNWSGGMPGVGGNNYEISIAVPEGDDIKAEHLLIDGIEVEITFQGLENGVLKVKGLENKSRRENTIGQSSKRPDFRISDPNSASIEIKSDCCQKTLNISNFKKGKIAK